MQSGEEAKTDRFTRQVRSDCMSAESGVYLCSDVGVLNQIKGQIAEFQLPKWVEYIVYYSGDNNTNSWTR
jgi:hypothetical protein